VTVAKAGRSNHEHDVLIGSDLLDSVGSITADALRGNHCAIVSDTNVAPLFIDRVSQSLISAGFTPIEIVLPAGEESKTLEQVGAICDAMIEHGLDRQSFVVGLGGGVIGDISGFVAAIFQRGIPHVQIPTTLLAMVDSSIGGKTGVNTRDGKNLIGAVHNPTLVIDDVDLLKTLPGREFNQGFAEIIKHAIIADAEMFEELHGTQQDAQDATALQSLIRRNIEIKSRFVAGDEFDETGQRALLNFGHTVGHGIERAGGYREFLHGEAISLGMVAACAVSAKRAGLPDEQRDAIVDLLSRFELPTTLPDDFPREEILGALRFDKKFEAGQIRFVLTPGIGSAYLSSDVTMEDIREAVEQL
jgi:3-dehydroquinate synthase